MKNGTSVAFIKTVAHIEPLADYTRLPSFLRTKIANQGCVLFRNGNAYNDDKKS